MLSDLVRPVSTPNTPPLFRLNGVITHKSNSSRFAADWPFMMFVTTPLIVCPSVGALVFVYGHVHVALFFAFLSVISITLASLWCAGCSDPGLVIRHAEKPPGSDWIVNSQVDAFRPKSAMFVHDCNVLVDKYDHTCPWVGTAIGANNIRCFWVFVTLLVPLALLYIIVICIALTEGAGDQLMI